MTEGGDRARARKAAGPDRPRYFDGGDVDRVMAILLALVSEVAAIRERIDTHERLSSPPGDRVESYLPTPVAETEREAWRDAYIKRLFRVVTEDIEALKTKSAASAGDDLD